MKNIYIFEEKKNRDYFTRYKKLYIIASIHNFMRKVL